MLRACERNNFVCSTMRPRTKQQIARCISNSLHVARSHSTFLRRVKFLADLQEAKYADLQEAKYVMHVQMIGRGKIIINQVVGVQTSGNRFEEVSNEIVTHQGFATQRNKRSSDVAPAHV